jgi:hypothetical protein
LRNGLLTLVVVWALYAGLTLALLAVLRPVDELRRTPSRRSSTSQNSPSR